MNDDLYTLKVACVVLQDLKKDEQKYKRAVVKTASKKLLEKKAWLGTALGIGATALGAYWLGNGGVKNLANDAAIVGNWMNPNWGQNAVIQYANSGALIAEDRNNYLIRRLSGARNWPAVKNRADAYMNANREAAYRNYRDWDAQSRGNRMIQNGVYASRNAYNNRMGAYNGNFNAYRYS